MFLIPKGSSLFYGTFTNFIHSFLQTSTVTVKINLRENYIGSEGARAVAEMLKENCYITDLVCLAVYYTY